MKFEFKPDASVFSDDPHYDLFDGGYISPEELLKDPRDVEAVCDAMFIVSEFLKQAEEAGVLEIG